MSTISNNDTEKLLTRSKNMCNNMQIRIMDLIQEINENPNKSQEEIKLRLINILTNE